MPEEKKYCLGFLFNPSESLVVLIRKEYPAWQAGSLNGVGGKIEENELPNEAMMREWREETGSHQETWYSVGNFYEDLGLDSGGLVHVFASWGNVTKAETQDEGKVGPYATSRLHQYPVLPNLKWIIPMIQQGYEFSATRETDK